MITKHEFFMTKRFWSHFCNKVGYREGVNLGRRRDGIQVMDTLDMKEDIKIIVFLVSIDIIFFMVDKYIKIQRMGER